MKHTPLVLLPAALAAAFLARPAPAHAFAEVARGALTATTTASLAYDSNILGRDGGPDDAIFTLSPSLRYDRAVGLGTIEADAGVGINRYFDLTQFDCENYQASLHVTLPTVEGSRESGSLYGGYSDQSAIDEDVGDQVRSKSWRGGFSGAYTAGPRTTLRADFSYGDVTRDKFSTDRTQWSAGTGFDYKEFLGGFGLTGSYRYASTQSSAYGSVGGIDQTSQNASTGLFYDFVSGLRASANLGYRWLDRGHKDAATGHSSNGYTFSLNLDGPFLPPRRFPKLKSAFSIGIQKSEAIGINDSGSTHLVGNLSLAWQARERTALTLSASRGQSLTAGNFSSINSEVRFGVTQGVGLRTQLSAGLAEEWHGYTGTGRNDRRTRANLGASYAFNRYWQVGASYAYTLSSSSLDLFDYDRHLLTGYVTAKF